MSERDIHCTICDMLHVYAAPSLIWFHPPNGGKRGYKAASALKSMGMKAGVPDLCFVLPDGRGAFMEIKTPKTVNRLSDEQKAFRETCWKQHIPYALVTNPDDALAILYEWGALLPVAYQRGQRNEQPAMDAAVRQRLQARHT
jgi:hypothetical protein